MTNVIDRAAIVIGVFLAAYGLLIWRSAFRNLSLANYIIVLSCAPVLLLGASKMKEWEYPLDQRHSTAQSVTFRITSGLPTIPELAEFPETRARFSVSVGPNHFV